MCIENLGMMVFLQKNINQKSGMKDVLKDVHGEIMLEKHLADSHSQVLSEMRGAFVELEDENIDDLTDGESVVTEAEEVSLNLDGEEVNSNAAT